MSITGGATAIGYFTHVWKPSYSQFGVPEENRKALRQIGVVFLRTTHDEAIVGQTAADPAADATRGNQQQHRKKQQQPDRDLIAVEPGDVAHPRPRPKALGREHHADGGAALVPRRTEGVEGVRERPAGPTNAHQERAQIRQ